MKQITLFVILCFLALNCKNKTVSQPTDKAFLIAFEDTTKQFGWGYKDLKGQVVIEPQYAMVQPDTFSDAIVFAFDKRHDMNDEKHGWIAINKQNQFVLKPFMYDNGPDYIQEGLFRFVQQDKMGFANIKGEKVIPAKYIFVAPFSDGMAAFCNDCQKKEMGEHWLMKGLFGFIDNKGNEVIPAQFEDIGLGFENGKATVIKNGQKMIINQKGEQIKEAK